MYRLMIKTHNITGLKYLCITKREDYQQYLGSGVYWKNHIKKYGDDISTEVIYESESYEDFISVCIETSNKYNIVLNEEFANLIPEQGYGNGSDVCNLVFWWKYASEEAKREIYNERSKTFKDNHWSKNEERRKVITKKISESISLNWSKKTVEERRECMDNLYRGMKRFHQDNNNIKYINWRKKIQQTMKEYCANNMDILSEKNRKSRLNTSKESALSRKTKIREVYATGKHDHLFERYSRERKGVDNPNAKCIVWYGEIYTKVDFEKNIGKVYNDEIKKEFDRRNDCFLMYDDTPIVYDVIFCPHCKKSSNNKKPSSFKRWHFENCKEKL